MAALAFFLTMAALLLLKLFTNWYRYSSVPGPIFAGATDFWRAYHQYRGQLRQKLLALHRRHGPLVRYGVKDISISDPSAIDIIYGSRAGFVTAESYQVLLGFSNGKEVASLVSTADETKHGILRRSVAKAFSQTNVLDYEPYIDQTILDLLEALSKHKTVDLTEMIILFSMDSATRVSYGESPGCLKTLSDVGGTIALIRQRFNHWGLWSSIPWLERLVYRNPFSMRIKRAPSSMAAKVLSVLKSRDSSTEDTSQPDLLQRFMQASQHSPETFDIMGVISLLMSTISGAGDTTASTMVAWLYLLMKNPKAMQKLVTEIDEASLSIPPSFAEVRKLPYLNAVLKESMRVYSTPTFPMERKVPSGGVVIASTFFPEGTTVGCMPAAVHMNTRVFGKDADVFRPERWLEADEETLKSMEAAQLGFSRGRRVCLGQHIATMQMKKVISSLLMTYELRLASPSASLESDFSPAVACLKPLYVQVSQRG